MTLEEFKKLIEYFKGIEQFIDKAQDTGLMLVDTDLYDNMWSIFHEYILAKSFNDEQIDAIYTWIYEYNFGKEPMSETINGKEESINTVIDLYKFIETIK